MSELTDQVLADLASIDTPTVCNALELVAPQRRASGFTVHPLVCARPDRPPIVGFAKTATIRARQPDSEPQAAAQRRDQYYAYVDAGPKPSVVVIEDLDEPPGFGSFWGEVNSSIHLGFGCLGVVTNGSVRDLPDLAEGFQVLADRIGPSHAHVHITGFAEPVAVAGMEVADGDLVHADQHGAVVIPHHLAGAVKPAADLVARRERVVIDAARQSGFDIAALRRAQQRAAEIDG